MTNENGVPHRFRLSVPLVPQSYSGPLYYFIGPGLGDTVNGFRIFHEVASRYPESRPIVYLDPRWKSLYSVIPELSFSEIRYYSEAPSAESRIQAVQPFHRTYAGIIDQMVTECVQKQAFIAMAGYKPADRLPRKETTIAMLARAIGLPLSVESQRPYCPLSDHDWKQARYFLDANGLREREYIVIAPFTWPDKMWTEEAWLSLIDSIHRTFALQTLVMGTDTVQGFDRPFVRHAMNLPLGTVAALIAGARCYIGLDSGLTHVAACSDVPIVTLNPRGKYPPFCVEPHSPFRWTILSPHVYGREQISVSTVEGAVAAALQHPGPPSCPLCGQGPYVLGIVRTGIMFLCRCGLIYRGIQSDSPLPLQAEQAGENRELPQTISGLNTIRHRLAGLLEKRGDSHGEAVELRYDHWDPIETNLSELVRSSGQRQLWWTWDAVFRFLDSCGWQIAESALDPERDAAGPRVSVSVQILPASSSEADPLLAFPWGRRTLRLPRSFYARWLSWGAFRNVEELEGLGLAVAGEGNAQEARALSLLAFKLYPSWKAFRRFVRVLRMTVSRSA